MGGEAPPLCGVVAEHRVSGGVEGDVAAGGGGGRGSGRAAVAPVTPGTMLGVLGGGPGVTPSPNKAAASSRCVPSGAERSRRREYSAPEKSSSAKRLQRGRMGRLMSVQSQPHTT